MKASPLERLAEWYADRLAGCAEMFERMSRWCARQSDRRRLKARQLTLWAEDRHGRRMRR